VSGKHWLKQLKVSEARLLSAVVEVGPLVDDIRQYLYDQPDEPKKLNGIDASLSVLTSS
jgi:hypothetical protein